MKECSIQKHYVKLLKTLRQKGLLFYFKVDNEGAGGRLNKLQMGLVSGVADLMVITKKTSFFIEFKTKKGVISKQQKEFAEIMNYFGLKVYYINSLGLEDYFNNIIQENI